VDILDLDWVAASGLVGDFGHPQNMPFVNSILKKYKLPKKENMFETILGQVAIYINATQCVRPNKIHLAMKVLKKAKKPRDVLSSELAKLADKITVEIDKQIEKFKKNAEVHGDLMISPLKSKYKITGAFMTKLSAEYFPTKTLFCYQRSPTGYHISARRHDRKVAVNVLLEKAIKGLKDAMSGGHAPAAGASIRIEDEDIFKKRLIKIHESMVAA
jgi:single-stranded DNA-specific DHH superfamily exonuclease